MSQVQDPAFMEAISKHMRVPARLSMGPGQQWREEEEEEEEVTRRKKEVPSALSMQVPDRLTYTEAPDMSPTPRFTASKLTLAAAPGHDPCWDGPPGDVFMKEAPQSPIRRSYSDQSFGRTPPGTPTRAQQTLAPPRPSSGLVSGRPPLHRSPPPVHSSDPDVRPRPCSPVTFSSPQSVLQMAKTLGLQASQRLLQAVSQRYRFRDEWRPPAANVTGDGPGAQLELSKRRTVESWSPEEDGGAAVELIILKRQVVKMSRRLASLERHCAERRNTEVVLFSLLLSACVLNVWLWIRR